MVWMIIRFVPKEEVSLLPNPVDSALVCLPIPPALVILRLLRPSPEEVPAEEADFELRERV